MIFRGTGSVDILAPRNTGLYKEVQQMKKNAGKKWLLAAAAAAVCGLLIAVG